MENGNWARRSFMSGLGAAVAAFTAGSRTAAAQTPARPAAFRAARHSKDEWLNTVRGKHRTIVDCATPSGAGEGMLYANNLYVANKSGYALDEGDVAVVVCLRHFATIFAYNDAMWAKYGKIMSDMVMFTDPKTKQAPSTNLLNSADYGMALSNLGNTIESVVKRGTHFAVCDMATTFFSTQLATATKGNQPDVYKELTSNLIPNSHLVAAGVLAVNRAQEYGYTLLTAL
jgi:hypothetical protein